MAVLRYALRPGARQATSCVGPLVLVTSLDNALLCLPSCKEWSASSPSPLLPPSSFDPAWWFLRLVQGLIADSFGQLGDCADAVARLCAKASTSLASCFEAPLKEFVRGVKAVKKVCADRSTALAVFQQVRRRAGGGAGGGGRTRAHGGGRGQINGWFAMLPG